MTNLDFLLTISYWKVAILMMVIFIFIDMLWLGFIASNLYTKQLGYLANLKNSNITFNLPVGLLAQAIIAFGLSLVIALVYKGGGNLSASILVSALIGFVIYATYDLTNLSFIKDWPWQITLIDIIWGTLQGTLAGAYGYWLLTKLVG